MPRGARPRAPKTPESPYTSAAGGGFLPALPVVPELPDVTVYVDRLTVRVAGGPLEKVRLASPFLLRTFDPPIREVEGKTVRGFRRIGKRIVFELEDDLFLVLHLMIAGRLRWKDRGAAVPGKVGLAAFDFPAGTVVLTEASSKKRASLYLVRGEEALAPFDRGGIEPLEATSDEFAGALRRENRTLKRAMTDPRLLSGIGNAYSDEILFDAQLSPVKRTHQLSDEELVRLHESTRTILERWTETLTREVGDGFPDKVTAFRDDFNVHGRYKQACRVCSTKVQRIRHASNEMNYCPRCQTGGKLLADRSLSRLLKSDWPKSIEELEELEATRPGPASGAQKSGGGNGAARAAPGRKAPAEKSPTTRPGANHVGAQKPAAKKKSAKKKSAAKVTGAKRTGAKKTGSGGTRSKR